MRYKKFLIYLVVAAVLKTVIIASGGGASELNAAENKLPLSVIHKVPFSPQAPFAEWKDKRSQDGCEEMAIIMAARWTKGLALSRKEAQKELFALSSYQEKKYGSFRDTSAEDTATIAREYYDLADVAVKHDISIEDIKIELSDGKIVITPMNGRALGNRYYTAPGPERHMVVIVGYDEKKRQFITNDPGTKRGEKFRYDYKKFWNAVGDYPSGNNIPIAEERKKAMIVVGPKK